MAKVTKVQFPSFSLQITGELYAPVQNLPGEGRKGAAVVISHPMTAIKEQTSTNYALLLASAGFWALTFDAGYQGESTGEPRGLEDPHQRVEDNKAAVTYLSSLQDAGIDPERIGMLGICASGGYCSYAAQSDSRIKALGTVSASCVGRYIRTGTVHETPNQPENPECAVVPLQYAAGWRNATSLSCGKPQAEAPRMFETDPAKIPEDADSFFKDAAEYYGNKDRGAGVLGAERSTQRIPPQSFDLMMCYDSFMFQNFISPRALLMIAGENAQTAHWSKTAIKTAKEPKELVVIKGKNHFDLYDDLEESGPKLVEFFRKYL